MAITFGLALNRGELMMGFSLELFFEELNEILAKDQKAAKTVKQIKRLVAEREQYAKECGSLTEVNE